MSMANVNRRERMYAIGTVPAPNLVVPIAAKQPEKSENLTPLVHREKVLGSGFSGRKELRLF
jgi:hypothetical protein